MKILVALIAAAITLAAASGAAAGPPRTSAKLFHVTAAQLQQIASVIERAAGKVKINGREHLDVGASCTKRDPAVNARGLGYRHIVCAFSGPGSLHVHGSVTFSIQGSTAIYAGQVCALGVCEPLNGKV